MRLAARVLNPGLESWWMTDHLQDGKPTVFFIDLISGILVPGFVTDKLVAGSNFPYGFTVEPDHP